MHVSGGSTWLARLSAQADRRPWPVIAGAFGLAFQSGAIGVVNRREIE